MRHDDPRLIDAIRNADEALVLVDAANTDEARFAQSQLQGFFDEAGRNVKVLALPSSARVVDVIPVFDPLAGGD